MRISGPVEKVSAQNTSVQKYGVVMGEITMFLVEMGKIECDASAIL